MHSKLLLKVITVSFISPHLVTIAGGQVRLVDHHSARVVVRWWWKGVLEGRQKPLLIGAPAW
jgi:hypothetical protein